MCLRAHSQLLFLEGRKDSEWMGRARRTQHPLCERLKWRTSPCPQAISSKTDAPTSDVGEFWDRLAGRKNFVIGALWLRAALTAAYGLEWRMDKDIHGTLDKWREYKLEAGNGDWIQPLSRRPRRTFPAHILSTPLKGFQNSANIFTTKTKQNKKMGSTVPDKHLCPLDGVVCFLLFSSRVSASDSLRG